MKKILITLIALAGIFSGKAQETVENDSLALLKSQLEYANSELSRLDAENQRLAQEKKWSEIWSKGRYTMIAYSPSASSTEYGIKSNASFGFALAKGNQYFFNKKPFGGMVKVGLDMRWTDISFIKYKKADYEVTDGWIDGEWGYGDDDDDSGFLDSFTDLGRYDLHVSAFCFGPVVSVAPLSHLNNAARFLRATLYCHYKPTFGVHLVSEDGEMDTSMAYCNMWDFGGKIQYRGLALGLEGCWGSGKYSQISSLFESDDEEETLPKIKRKFSNFRIYIAFSF
ncbi:MAG: hypothetical protein K2K68_02835 [Duncaniella sp.]|nr:hypothetical protein [Duncaniella sp.]MDE6582089.1 hypothetical protein [Duncaniella sp.]